ncbi:DUF4328 domain-containing protein [Micromonospora sp. PLK6-60]|uniref:DUF4328 domain-containing protein n=1 Tax=Micromonospora sp. PLK6-60 TaxID=2873383 RepID=UPI001CA6536B|nr:DUF4328 domain-containing protein [Micromonospora sp. PLK6-60]MBY8872142.1 DUF4328 domain-containing protein [Micromonospora sp. PLK6-60]
MLCRTCGDTLSPVAPECPRCNGPQDRRPVLPGLPTYRVRGIGLAASIAVGATAVIFLLMALLPVLGWNLAERAAAERRAELLLGPLLADLAGSLLFVLAYLTAAVLVIIWTWRARKNTDAFPGARPSLGPGWAIAGWLVPFANFVVPARVVSGIARDSLSRRRAPALVAVWWAAWLLFSFGERIASRSESRRGDRLAEDPVTTADFQAYADYYRDALGLRLAAAVAGLVAAVAFVLLVRRISAAQQDRIDRGAPAWPVTPGMTLPPGAANHPWPVATPSPQVTAPPNPVSPPAPPVAGGTIGA